MTLSLRQFVQDVILPCKVKRVYIAIMLLDGQYDLEVETVPNDTIGGTYRTGSTSLLRARIAANSLESELVRKGIYVCKTREEWED